MEDELAIAISDLAAPRGRRLGEPGFQKIFVGAYSAILQVRAEAESVPNEIIKQIAADGWTEEEQRLLRSLHEAFVKPGDIKRSKSIAALEKVGAPVTETTIHEARASILRGMMEAHERAELFRHPLVQATGDPVYSLLDDALVLEARRGNLADDEVIARTKRGSSSEHEPDPETFGSEAGEARSDAPAMYAKTTNLRFSDVIKSPLDVHVAVAVNGLGARLATASFPVTGHGYRQLSDWAIGHGAVHASGIEGTGSHGAGLSWSLTARRWRVVEVGRVNRQLRRRRGKTDAVDAESAARSVLAGDAAAQPKSGDGIVEMIRHLKIARDTALKAWTQAMVTLKTLLVNAPQPLRERFIGITGNMTLVRAITALRPGKPTSTTASAKMALRALANRWLMLHAEIGEHEAVLEKLVRAKAPALMEAPGVSTGTIADMLIVLRDNPQRIRSEAAFAKLGGVCPVPASSGKTSRHRLNRDGNRRANAALYRVALVRMRHHPPTREYIQRRTAEGKSPREIRRCLERYIAREIFHHLCVAKGPETASMKAA